jgi:chromosome segregation ATPase
MSMPTIRHEVALILGQANDKISDAKAKLANGSDREKVRAAGELSFLERERDELEQRLKEIERDPGATETLFQWVREEGFILALRLETWIAGSGHTEHHSPKG